MPRKPKRLFDPFKRPERWFYKKVMVREPDGSRQMYLENPPLTFAQLPPDEYLTRFFDTGDEHQGTVS